MRRKENNSNNIKKLTEKQYLNKLTWDKLSFKDKDKIKIYYFDSVVKNFRYFTFEEYEWAEKDNFSLKVSTPKGKKFWLPFHRIRFITYSGMIIWMRREDKEQEYRDYLIEHED